MINLIVKYSDYGLFNFYPAKECKEAEAFFCLIRLKSIDSSGEEFFDSSFVIKVGVKLGLFFNFNIDKRCSVKLANFLERSGINLDSSFSKVFFNQ